MKRKIILLYYFIMGKIIGKLYYDKMYLSGRHFSSPSSQGWKWVVKDYWGCKKLGVNRFFDKKYWPSSPYVRVVHPENIHFSVNDLNNFHTMGTYFQAIGRIDIGEGTYIAPNVGLITSNHSFKDLDKHDIAKPILLGKKCWIGMNSIILPGVQLGEGTIVGAGSVVTKSFTKGNCIIAGNPAKLIRVISEDENN